MNRLAQPFRAPLALVIMLALTLGLSACGKESSSSGAASTPGGPAAGPAPAASSPASGLPASQLGSMPTGGSKNSTNAR